MHACTAGRSSILLCASSVLLWMDASEVELPQQPHGPGLVQQPQAPPSSAVTPLSPPLPLPPLPFLSPFFAPPSMASFLASFCTPRKHRAIRRQRADSKTCNQHDMEHTSSASCTTATRPRDPGAPAIMSCAPAGMSCAPHAPQRFRAGQRRHGRAAHRICTPATNAAATSHLHPRRRAKFVGFMQRSQGDAQLLANMREPAHFCCDEVLWVFMHPVAASLPQLEVQQAHWASLLLCAPGLPR